MERTRGDGSAGVPPAPFFFLPLKKCRQDAGATEQPIHGMQLHDLTDLLRYSCPSAQGLLPQRPHLALLVPRMSARIYSGAIESAPTGSANR